MTLTVELPEDVAEAVKARAAIEGVSVEDWLQALATRHVKPAADQEQRRPRPRRRISEVIAEIVADVPSEELAKLPTDGATQVDHYVYGLPKRSE